MAFLLILSGLIMVNVFLLLFSVNNSKLKHKHNKSNLFPKESTSYEISERQGSFRKAG